ncbi:aspartate/glutamate racemase family protein [Faunimonas sp. B44]|uniref:aspartate/glutamate racemase family protein n=1 Tax=Faunimonas sp. B44 TaxID=3461493 RepID=UPI004043D18D
MRIRDVVPVRSPKVIEGMKAQRQRWARPGVEIEVVPVEQGPFSMEFATEEVLAGPHVLKAVRQAENDGCDAVVLDCMVDPVLRAARETVRIPVLAPGQSGLTVANLLGARVAVIGMRNGQQLLEEHIRAYGFERRICSMHTVNAPPADLIESKDYCLEIIEREITSALTQHRAEVVLFGCTAMSGYVDALSERFDVPIVEPMACAINMAIALANMGLSHSKRCYESLPRRGTAPGSIDLF